MHDHLETNFGPGTTHAAVGFAGASIPTPPVRSSSRPSLTGAETAEGSTSILCGTDFSEPAALAVEVAAALAKRLGARLVLVHAVKNQSSGDLPHELRKLPAVLAETRLHDLRERLPALPVGIVEAIRNGVAETVLLEEAVAQRAKLLVLASALRDLRFHREHGGVAERVAAAAVVPTLVVRDPAPLLRWAHEERRLRIFVCADSSAPSDAALLWVDRLRKIGPCDIVVVFLESTSAPISSDDVFPSLFLDEMALKDAHAPERQFRERVRALFGDAGVRARFEKDWTHSEDHLIQLAKEERADLIVVGTHSRHGWHRLGHHSVSRGILHYAPLNVLCVPRQAVAQTPPRP